MHKIQKLRESHVTKKHFAKLAITPDLEYSIY